MILIKPKNGFALLMTLIVVSVVITIGLTILDLTIKQLKLSTNSKDSENAFHATNAGIECARYWRLKEKDAFEAVPPDPDGVSIECFDANAVTTEVSEELSVGVYKHDFELTWGSGSDRCSKVSMITFSSNTTDPATSLTNIQSYLPSYPNNTKTCDPGGRCTIISVQGYNKPCPGSGEEFPIGTIQREVLLEL
ncbi:MAG: pilus assembly PilX N-terminal domain-containing protein [Candidatus Paceibacterota bacterium]